MINTTQKVTILSLMHAEHYIKYILILLENFVDIIDYKHCLIISANIIALTQTMHTQCLCLTLSAAPQKSYG